MRLDPEDGLYYDRARFYNALQGRFTQQDPGGAAGSPNLYMYAADSPVNFVDPTGLAPVTPEQIARLLKARYDDETGILGMARAIFGGNPQNRDSYKKLKAALDQFRKDCQKAPPLPLLPGPCQVAIPAVIAALINALGARQFMVRQAASAGLESLLPFAIASLRVAAASPDPEVSRRAQQLIAKFEDDCFAQAFKAVPAADRKKYLSLFWTAPNAFPEFGAMAGVFTREGIPLPPPPPPPAPRMPAPPAPPPPPPQIFV